MHSIAIGYGDLSKPLYLRFSPHTTQDHFSFMVQVITSATQNLAVLITLVSLYY